MEGGVKLVYTADAAKDLRRHSNVAARLRRVIDEYAAGGGAHANQVTSLVGRPEKRLRLGAWRIIFAETVTEIVVVKIAPRGKAY
jgi:mRNA interferase RelE/StbE